jgi:hypothetical protein
MAMTRRGFLTSIMAASAAAAAVELDPERLLWIPGARTFFLPSQVQLAKPDITEVVKYGTDLGVLEGTPPVITLKRRGGVIISGEKRLTLGSGEVYGFDEKWTILRGTKPDGTPMNEREKLAAAMRLFPVQNQKRSR